MKDRSGKLSIPLKKKEDVLKKHISKKITEFHRIKNQESLLWTQGENLTHIRSSLRRGVARWYFPRRINFPLHGERRCFKECANGGMINTTSITDFEQ